VTIGFTLFAAAYGFPVGWFVLGGLGVAFMLLIFLLQEPFKANQESC